MSDELKTALEEFGRFARSLKGDEKSEAQLFLDHFFRALGHGGVQEAGATMEFRIAKKPGSAQLELRVGTDRRAVRSSANQPNDGRPSGPSLPKKGGKKFADLLWPGRVLIEMKQRGANLEKHYDQLFEYWQLIVPNRPAYAILCNFDEFWIYDFNTQLFDPVDRVPLRDLVQGIAAFNFLLPTPKRPIFENNRVEVTRKAADRMAQLFRDIVARGEDRARVQQFILQLLVAMVAEDIDLLPREIVTELLGECAGGNRSVGSPAHPGGNRSVDSSPDEPTEGTDGAMPSSYDLLGGLFRQMATEEPARAGRYAGVRYFNGGLFAVVDPIELKRTEAYALHDAAKQNDWSKVKPEIFGTLFQHSMDKKERHAFGAHFTSEFDIQKVVGPTIVRPWRERIEAAGKSATELRKALADLRQFRVLDPACGSGNFLFVAYREMKRLERDLLVRLQGASRKEPLESAISLHQFHGIDNQPFAVELAKVTLMLAKELELIEAKKFADADQLLIEEKPLPLDNLDKNIVCADALFTDWPKAGAIIGNPPYLGSRYLAKEHGYDYANKLYARFPGVPKMADLCTHWFRLAHDALPPGGRAGLVGTNTIRQNESREASLDYIIKHGGIITDAVGTEVWSGDAAVHVSIVNWMKTGRELSGRVGVSPAGEGVPPARTSSSALSVAAETGKDRSGETPEPAGGTPTLPAKCRLAIQRGDRVDSPWETYELPQINSALSPATDVTDAQVLAINAKAKKCFTGQNPVNAGFFLTPVDAQEMIRADARNREVIFPYMIGRDLVEDYGPTRWIIDFGKRDLFAAMAYPIPFEHVKERVMPIVLAKAEAEKKAQGKEITRYTRIAQRWWQFYDYRPGTIAAINSVSRWIALSRTSKRPIFEFISRDIHADSKLMVFAFEDDYSFGILQSDLHWQWTVARGSTLKGDQNYTSDTVFDTFPWPQTPTRTQIATVAEAAVALRALRREIMGKLGYSLRALYRTLEEPGANPLREAHTRLDTAVRAAYGMPSDADPLAFLLALNLELAAKEKAGEKITRPGRPPSKGVHEAFITADCLRLVQS